MSEFERADLPKNIVLERLAIKKSESDESSGLSDSVLTNNKMLKSILRMNSVSDSELDYFKNIALDIVETRLRKTIFRARRQNRHRNSNLILPYGPVWDQEDIKEVKYGNKILKKSIDYDVFPAGDSFRLTLKPMAVKGDRNLMVTYEAGYENLSFVPRAVVSAVVTITDFLFRNNHNPMGLNKLMDELLHEYDTGGLY